MNQTVPFLTRQVVYSFLVGLILGGLLIGLFDAYAKKPLLSSAHAPNEYTQYCWSDGVLCENPYAETREVDNNSGTGSASGTGVKVLDDDSTNVRVLDDDGKTPVSGGDWEPERR